MMVVGCFSSFLFLSHLLRTVSGEDTIGACDDPSSSNPFSFLQNVRLDMTGPLTALMDEDEIAKSFLEAKLAEVYNSLSDCKEEGKTYRIIEDASLLIPESSQVIVEQDVLGMDTSETFSILVEFNMRCIGCNNSTLGVFGTNTPCECPSPLQADVIFALDQELQQDEGSALLEDIKFVDIVEARTLDCPAEETTKEFTSSSILDLAVNTAVIEASAINANNPDLIVLQDLYTAAYSFAAQDTCDRFFRKVTSSKVSRVVPRSEDTVTVQIDTTSQCQGESCDPTNIDLFDPYNYEPSSATRKLVLAKKTPADFSPRRLQDDVEDICHCPVNAPLDQGVSEEKFVLELIELIEMDTRLSAISSVKPCPPEEPFTAGVLVVANSTTDLSTVEDTLVSAIVTASNRNVDNPDTCDPFDKKVSGASLRVVRQRSAGRRRFLEETTNVPSSSSAPSTSSMPSTSASPIESPSSAPSEAPTFPFSSFEQYLFFQVTGTCRGCGSEFILNDDTSGRRLQEEDIPCTRRREKRGKCTRDQEDDTTEEPCTRRRERRGECTRNQADDTTEDIIVAVSQDVKSNCYCPLEAELVIETPTSLLAAFQEEVQKIEETEGIRVDVLSVQQGSSEDCEDLGPTSAHESSLDIIFVSPGISSFSGDELDATTAVLTELYNDANLLLGICDPLNRQVISVEVLSQEAGSSYVKLSLNLEYTCQGCTDNQQITLFDYDQAVDARQLDESTQIKLECICPGGSSKRGLMRDEFVSALKERISIFVPEVADTFLSIGSEMRSLECPSDLSSFNASSVLELTVTKEASQVTLEDPDFSSLADLYTSAYNVLSQNFCDASYREVKSVKLSRLEVRDEVTVAVQVDAFGSCRGCDTAAIELFDDLPFLAGARRLAVQDELPPDITLFLHPPMLRQEELDGSDEVCSCPVDKIGDEGASEEEFIPYLQSFVETTPSFLTIDSVKSCPPRSPFQSSLLIVVNSTQDLRSYEEFLSDAFLNATSRNVDREDFCFATKAEFDGVDLVIGSYNSNDEFIYFGIEQETEGRRFLRRQLDEQVSEPPSFSAPPSQFLNISSAPSLLPSTYPSLSPTAGFKAQAQYIQLTVSGTCRGCQSNNFLTNDVSGRRLVDSVSAKAGLPEKRRLQSSASSNCFCPLGTVIYRETASQIRETFQEELEASNDADIEVISVREIRPVECASPVVRSFRSNKVTVNFEAINQAPDLDRVIAIAVDAYNSLTQNNFCDPLFRRTRSASILSSTFTGTTEQEKNGLPCRAFSMEISFAGECRNCEDGTNLLESGGNGNISRLLRESSTFLDEVLLGRSLEGSGENGCICEKDTIADRAPFYSEFQAYLEQKLLEDGEIGASICSVDSIFIFSLSPSEQPSVSMAPTSCIDDKSCLSGDNVCTNSTGLCADAYSCSGTEACRDVFDLDLGGGSCVGDGSCKQANALSVGFQACNGEFSCKHVSGAVGTGACTGISSCEGLSGSIGDSSCVGDKSCYKSESPDPTVSIASNACTGVSSCEGLSGSVGDFSCVGENSCDKSESPDLTVSIASNACTGISSCEGLSGSIGDSSCVGDKSCYKSESPDLTVSIASNACTGVSSCEGLSGTIGTNSCKGDSACSASGTPGLTVSIASNACNGEDSCTDFLVDSSRRRKLKKNNGEGDVDLFIGQDSCNAENACKGFVGTEIGAGACNAAGSCESFAGASIGAGACNEEASCKDFKGDFVGENSCNAAGSCRGFNGTSVGANACSQPGSCTNFNGTEIGDDACNCENCCTCEGIGCSILPDVIPSGFCNQDYECVCGNYPNVPASSCDGFNACDNSQDMCINVDSCVGTQSCNNVVAALIGEGSCKNSRSCSGATGEVGDISCTGADSCNGINATIGDYSCVGDSTDTQGACVEFKGTVGDSSCVGKGLAGADFRPCGFGIGTIGDGSCVGDYPCTKSTNIYIGDNACSGSFESEGLCFRTKDIIVEDNSCNGEFFSCYKIELVSIGEESCNGDSACYKAFDSILGTGTCNSLYSCEDIVSTDIGDNSCNYEKSCYQAYESSVGSSSCGEVSACQEMFFSSIGSGSCNGGYENCFRPVYSSIGSSSCLAFPEEIVYDDDFYDDDFYDDDDFYTFVTLNVCSNIYQTSIGSGSCKGLEACESAYESVIGGSACGGPNACSLIYFSDVASGACNGLEVCDMIDSSTIAQGACNGDYACNSMISQTIGRSSCSGYSSCYALTLSTVALASYSCIGDKSCENSDSADIGNNSCNGISSCQKTYFLTVGDRSCLDYASCYQVDDSTIGDSSCQGEYSCLRLRASTIIGSTSCVGYAACESLGAGSCIEPSTIGDGSCRGIEACNESYDLPIGTGSCVGDASCIKSNTGEIGNFSCRGVMACGYAILSTIGAGSCQGEYACPFLYSVEIGDNSCNCDNCCQCLPSGAVVPPNSCNSLTYTDIGCCNPDGLQNT